MSFMVVSCQQRSARMGFAQDYGGERAPTYPSLCSVSFVIPGFLSWSPYLSSFSSSPACELVIHRAASPLSPWCSLCSIPSCRASCLSSVTVFVPLSLPLLVRLLVLRYFHCDLPSLCSCLCPLSVKWAPPSPCNLGTRQGNSTRRNRCHVLHSCTESHSGHQQQDMVTVRKDLQPWAGSSPQGWWFCSVFGMLRLLKGWSMFKARETLREFSDHIQARWR